MKWTCKLQTGKLFETYKMNRRLLWMVKLRVIFYDECAYFLKEIHILTERNCYCGSCIKNKLETGMGTSPKIDIGMANKFIKRCSTSWVTRQTQIKTTVIHHCTPVGVG